MGYYFRFTLYSFVILLALSLVWFALKSYGETQPLSSYQTKLIQKLNQYQKPIIWAPIENSDSKNEFVWLKAKHQSGEWIVDNHNQSSLLLTLGEFKNTFKFLFIDIKGPAALPQLRTILTQNNSWENIIICSRADGVLKDLRALEPEWTYCSGEIFLTRFLALNSLALGSLAPIRSDVFFIHLDELKLNENLSKIITESKRQNKLIFTGPVASPLSEFKIDHWLVQ